MHTPRDETVEKKRSFRLPILLLLLVLSLGIGLAVSRRGPRPAIPLSEVTLKNSGVTVSDVQTNLTATDWPAWRGPSVDGQSPDQTLPTNWGPSANVKWRSDVPGRGHSSPIVVGDSVLLGHRHGISNKNNGCCLMSEPRGPKNGELKSTKATSQVSTTCMPSLRMPMARLSRTVNDFTPRCSMTIKFT